MDSSSQLTIAYDMLYYVKLAALSIKIICRNLNSFCFSDISSLVSDVIFYFSIKFKIG